MIFHAVFQPVPEGFVAFIEELPGTNTQGQTLDEARRNLREAGQMVLQANRMLAKEFLCGQQFIRETMDLIVA
ncbi:MAG: type II toxin-antitoxin system HicB family antitoxin [Phycisphaeraceae bacterium]|nr:type II toxin-antitoxin system HicB family antitoxin [Phycisphaeraceae bacterium]